MWSSRQNRIVDKSMTQKDIYDNLLVVLIVSLIAGYAGGLLSPVHLVEIVLIPYLLGCRKLLRQRVFNSLFVFAFIWFSFSLLSLLWATDLLRGFATVIVYFFRFLMCFELLAFSMAARNPLASISKGWLVAVLLTSVVGMWEIITDHHLAMARETELSNIGMIVQRAQASVLFYNPNTYSLFLLMAFPFMLYRLMTGDKKWLTVIALVLSCYIIIRNASRGAILGIGIMIFITLASSMKRKRYRGYAILAMVMIAALLVYFGESLFSSFILRMETQGMQDGARFEIWAGAWDVFLKSHGLGVGAGSMTAVLGSLNHFGIGYAHCLLLESLVEGGVVFFFMIIGFLWKICKAYFSEPEKNIKIFLGLALITFPIYSIINSEYLRSPFVWCFFMCVFLFAKHQKLDVFQQQKAK